MIERAKVENLKILFHKNTYMTKVEYIDFVDLFMNVFRILYNHASDFGGSRKKSNETCTSRFLQERLILRFMNAWGNSVSI